MTYRRYPGYTPKYSKLDTAEYVSRKARMSRGLTMTPTRKDRDGTGWLMWFRSDRGPARFNGHHRVEVIRKGEGGGECGPPAPPPPIDNTPLCPTNFRCQVWAAWLDFESLISGNQQWTPGKYTGPRAFSDYETFIKSKPGGGSYYLVGHYSSYESEEPFVLEFRYYDCRSSNHVAPDSEHPEGLEDDRITSVPWVMTDDGSISNSNGLQPGYCTTERSPLPIPESDNCWTYSPPDLIRPINYPRQRIYFVVTYNQSQDWSCRLCNAGNPSDFTQPATTVTLQGGFPYEIEIPSYRSKVEIVQQFDENGFSAGLRRIEQNIQRTDYWYIPVPSDRVTTEVALDPYGQGTVNRINFFFWDGPTQVWSQTTSLVMYQTVHSVIADAQIEITNTLILPASGRGAPVFEAIPGTGGGSTPPGFIEGAGPWAYRCSCPDFAFEEHPYHQPVWLSNFRLRSWAQTRSDFPCKHIVSAALDVPDPMSLRQWTGQAAGDRVAREFWLQAMRNMRNPLRLPDPEEEYRRKVARRNQRNQIASERQVEREAIKKMRQAWGEEGLLEAGLFIRPPYAPEPLFRPLDTAEGYQAAIEAIGKSALQPGEVPLGEQIYLGTYRKARQLLNELHGVPNPPPIKPTWFNAINFQSYTVKVPTPRNPKP